MKKVGYRSIHLQKLLKQIFLRNVLSVKPAKRSFKSC